MSIGYKQGSTSKMIPLVIISSTTSLPVPLTYNAAGISAYYWRAGSSPIEITLTDLVSANAAYSSGAFGVINADRGWHRLDTPNAALAAGADWVIIGIEADGIVPVSILVDLTGDDYRIAAATELDIADAVRSSDVDGLQLQQILSAIAASASGKVANTGANEVTLYAPDGTTPRIVSVINPTTGERTVTLTLPANV